MRRQTAAGDHTMQVGVMEQGLTLSLTPSMEHGEKAYLRAQVLGISGDCEQGFRCGSEQDAIEFSLILIGNCCNLLR